MITPAKIGSVTLSSPTITAPMEGVSCEAFLKTCAYYGAGMVMTQAIESVDDNFYDARALESIPVPVAFQIMTSHPETAARLAREVKDHVDVIDLNFGCPLKEVLGKKAGGYLLSYPHLMERIISAVKKEVDIPVTIKIRKGFDDKRITFNEIAQMARRQGVDAITLHARTVRQAYTGDADWESIKELKSATEIPVIANGDIRKPGHAKYLLERGYADAVMIGRTARDDPRIFDRINDALQSRAEQQVSRKELMLRFFSYFKQQRSRPLTQLKDHVSWMLSGAKQAKRLKTRVRQATSTEGIERIIKGLEE
ncbi:MAG: tRNA dihydrouridine synthase [Nanoarchaeota archaeon]